MWIYILGGALAGAGAVGIPWMISAARRPAEPVEQVAKAPLEVERQLTQIDILETPCSQEIITAHGMGLCREMWCRMNTRGGASSQTATSKECESISSMMNHSSIISVCKAQAPASQEIYKSCLEFFDRRL